MPTYDRLPNIGRVRAYDAGPRAPFMDRYLVLFEDQATMDPRTYESVDRPRPYGLRMSLGMSEHPQHPQGVGIMDYAYPPDTWGGSGGHRWRRVPFASLPDDVRRCVLDTFAEDR